MKHIEAIGVKSIEKNLLIVSSQQLVVASYKLQKLLTMITFFMMLLASTTKGKEEGYSVLKISFAPLCCMPRLLCLLLGLIVFNQQFSKATATSYYLVVVLGPTLTHPTHFFPRRYYYWLLTSNREETRIRRSNYNNM